MTLAFSVTKCKMADGFEQNLVTRSVFDASRALMSEF